MSSSQLDKAILLSHKIQRDDLQPADHIYSWRRLYVYSHHGIYDGNGKVIHFTGSPSDSIAGMGSITSSSSASRPCLRCGPKIRASGVVSSCLECFLKKGKLRRYLYGVSGAELTMKIRGMCTTAPSDPAEDVISRAEILLQNNGFGGYNLRENNCEDFALYCKTGYSTDAELSRGSLGRSSQMKSVGAIVFALFKAKSSSLLEFVTNYSNSRLMNDIGVRGDVKKIDVQDLSAHSTLDRSSQTKSVRAVISALFKPKSSPLLEFMTNYSKSRLMNDIGVRGDVKKIDVQDLSAHSTLDRK